MAEKTATAEERAAREIAEYIECAWLQVSRLRIKGRLAFIEVAAVKVIRAAVAAETERCAVLAEQPRIVMPLAVEPIEETIAFTQRCIAAAIRATPEEKA